MSEEKIDILKNEDGHAHASGSGMGAKLRRYFLTGIFVTAPISITLYIAYVFFSFIDTHVQRLLPQPYNEIVYGGISFPGVGVIIAFFFFVVVGWFASNIMGRFLISIGERILDRIPVIRSLYGAIKQVFETITQTQSDAFREVVMLEYPRKGVWSIGFVTGSSKGEVQERVADHTINVFVPTTPNPTSGFLLFVPRKELKYMKMSVEEGIKLVVSAGIITPAFDELMAEKTIAKKRGGTEKTAAKSIVTPEKTSPKAVEKAVPKKKAAPKKAAPKKTAAKKTATKKSTKKK
jgi:uncharacterized membrane protein